MSPIIRMRGVYTYARAYVKRKIVHMVKTQSKTQSLYSLPCQVEYATLSGERAYPIYMVPWKGGG